MDTKLVYFVIINWYSIVWIISCFFSLTGSYRTTASPDCGDVYFLNIDHAANRRQYNGTKYLSNADVDCDEGYYIKGQTQLFGISTQTITCSYTGKWKDIPICIPKDCGPLKDLTIPNADLRLLFSGTNYESKAAIICDEGYYDLNKYDKLEGISTTMITCSVNGTWTDLPNCTRKDCGNVNELYIDHAANIMQNNGTKYTSTADVDCDEGYYIRDHAQMMGISTQTITCSKTGKWTDVPICIPKDCGDLQNINIINIGSRVSINGTKYTAIANVSCDVGFKDENGTQVPGVTSKIITCNKSGVWDNLPKCVRKDCGDVKYLNLNNTNKTVQLHNDTKLNSTADVDCLEGYFNNSTQLQTTEISTTKIRCSDEGKWINLPLCERKDCGGLHKLNIPNAENRTLINGTKYTSVANISCDMGYTKHGEQTEGISTTEIECTKTGNWSNIPTCIRKDCVNMFNLNVSHAQIRYQNNGTMYESTGEIVCDDGYYNKKVFQMTGTSTTNITCIHTGKWQNVPECIPKDCGNLTSPANGKVTLNSTILKSNGTYSCNKGYTVVGNVTVTCQATGFWSDNTTVCQIKDCGRLAIPANGNIRFSNNTTVYGSNATFTCDAGYILTGSNTINCMASGHWSDNTTYCKIKDCGDPKPLNNGSVDHLDGTTFGASALYKCNPGYTLHGDNSTACLADGTWQGIEVKCTLNTCNTSATFTIIANGKADVTTAHAFYQCNIGFTLHGDSSLYCLLNGTWNKKPPTCRLTDCGNLTKPDNGNVTFVNTTYNSTATFTCNDGYSLTKNGTSVCNASGSWTSIPKCKIKDCGGLDKLNILNAENRSLINGTKYTSVAIISCDVGYTKHGEQKEGISTTEIECTKEGKWYYIPTCIRKDCGNIFNLNVSHARVRHQKNGTKYESTGEIECDDGYFNQKVNQTIGNSTTNITCYHTGKWQNLPKCVPKACDSLVNPPNGYVNPVQGHTMYYNDNATYTCNTGYRMQGAGFVTCTARGNWSSPPPLCKDIDECAEYHTDCDLYASCTNTKGSYSCNCLNGFRDLSSGRGQKCQDIDECSNSYTNFCNKHGSRCINYMGGFICMCFQGWTGGNCTEDIDECADNTTCGPHAKCTNSDGSYSCTCDDGYPQGDPKVHCYNCGLLVPPEDGFVVTRNGTKFGASSEFRCNPGYTLYGDSFTTCLSNGTWQNYHVNCILDKKAVPTICFSCDGMSSPEYCDKVEHCQPNQICYTESYQTDYGKVFRSGCMDEQQCHREETGTSNSVCVECCTNEMCNNKGCGNSDFPPREHRGPMCFDCQHIGDISSCLKVTMCASDQVCSIEKQQWGDTYHYKLGCTHHLCNSLLHQISGTVSSCHACCRDDYCNKNCTSSSSSPGEILVG